ncbi:TPA: pilus assembly protein, partial [Escherichia coli]|nr:pilus assembly protein [Escherichia coli]HBA9522912.1 pilus assembly protein [Escherichia coli]HBA9550846.1 pilus assembly protein [Escherichia coli]HBA9560318.1 pilus assembly protein [Escherichia coli]
MHTDKKILHAMTNRNGMKTSEVAEMLKVTVYQARYVLLRMETEGRIYRTPLRQGSATIWYAKSSEN